jgi:hypothetical protein
LELRGTNDKRYLVMSAAASSINSQADRTAWKTCWNFKF